MNRQLVNHAFDASTDADEEHLVGGDCDRYPTIDSFGQDAAVRRCLPWQRFAAVSLVGVGLLASLTAVVGYASWRPRVAIQGADLTATQEKVNLADLIAKKMAERKIIREDNAHDELFPLGAGFCTDHHGSTFDDLETEDGKLWMSADVAADGSSHECAKKCLEDSECSGYATYGATKCGLIKTGYPSWADGKGMGHCFYKHQFPRNTTDIYAGSPTPMPKIIWGFWENLPKKGSNVVPSKLPPLIDICVASWRQLNPDWEVRLLNESTMGQWLTASDLPADYEKQIIQHKSDAIRIAALEKYGGVWIDASAFLLKPLSDILANDSSAHTFMHLRTYWSQDTMFDRRVNYTHYVENWFMATPPGDPVFHRTRECVLELQPKLEKWMPMAMTGMFSPVQLEELFDLTINTYLSMHACFLKTIDEDAAIWHWYNSPRVKHLDAGVAGLRLPTLVGWDNKAALEIKHRFFDSFDQALFDNVSIDEVNMLKFGGVTRKAIWNLSERQLWCDPSTFHKFVTSIGLKRPGVCDE